MGQALYRKYRSKSLAEIVGQEHITETLSKALQTGRISHAYLFTGPRGVGKTSIARILAHEINDLPYDDDSTHMDIIEIDAASNRRIDEIRELRDKVFVAPTSAKYKVYIIDEVHMLTKEAFNALLKTLEEPPAHVVFILATTDAHKLPETIVSRTQRYSFKPVKTAKVVAHLRMIASKENITIDDAALTLLAEHGEGSFRDSISMLDQARSHNEKLTATDIQRLLGIPSTAAVEAMFTTLMTGSPAALMSQLIEMYDQGYQAAAIAKQIAGMLRGQLIAGGLVMPHEKTLEMLTKLLEVPIAYDSAHFLEITLLGAMPADSFGNAALPKHVQKTVLETTEKTEESVSAKTETKKVHSAPPQPQPSQDPAESLTDVTPPQLVVEPAAEDAEKWEHILGALKVKHNTLYGLIRMAQPDFSREGVLCLTFAFDFHSKRVSDTQNQQKLRAVIKEVLGKSLKLECLVDKNAKHEPPRAPAVGKKTGDLANISNIFGGGELVE